MSEQIGLIFFFSATVLSVLIVAICSFKQYVNNLRNSQGSLCEKMFRRGRRRREEGGYSDQYYADRVMAEALQRRLNEEERERERVIKRKERRMWYEYYMKPCTMVVATSNLLYSYAKGDSSLTNDGLTADDDDNRKMEVKHGKHQTLKDEDDEFADSDVEEIGENSKKRKESKCISCDEDEDDDENATLYLKLPTRGRLVDGTCALCIEEYEVGDDVVWSDLQCSHAFHKECLMQWLSKGKKRCPICRHWFVPGTKIDDQKIAHGEAWKRALSEMEQRENEERERQEEFEANQEEPQAVPVPNNLEPMIAENTCATNTGTNTNTGTGTPMGQNIISETSVAKSREVELGSTVQCTDSKDSEHSHCCYDSSFETSATVDIENQQTPQNQKGTAESFRAQNVSDDEFKGSREAQEHINGSSMKSENHIADEYTQA